MKKFSRRKLLAMSAPITAGLMTTGISASGLEKREKGNNERLKLMVVGGHPDDPETACGGIIARYAKNGHEVVSVYLTRGERGIPGKIFPEAAVIREEEGRKACKIMGARPVFMDQINGYVELNNKRYDEMWKIIEEEDPDIVITHWPIDTHPDHRVCSLLVYESWLRSDKRFALYYFEVESGSQTQNFNPTDYVDITDVIDIKHEACFQHVSQHIKETYYTSILHGKMEVFRGMEGGFKFAEAFVKQMQSKNVVL
jgi:LmbE family N-acetylglucosaminyl deacetylase